MTTMTMTMTMMIWKRVKAATNHSHFILWDNQSISFPDSVIVSNLVSLDNTDFWIWKRRNQEANSQLSFVRTAKDDKTSKIYKAHQ